MMHFDFDNQQLNARNLFFFQGVAQKSKKAIK